MRTRIMPLGWLFAIALLAGGATLPGQEVIPGPGATWSLAAAGDAIITRRVAQFENAADPRFSRMAEVIRGADAAFLNLEISLFNHREYAVYGEVENGGNWEIGPPEAATDLKAMGFDLFSRANNHTTDYGVEGMKRTNALLDQIGIVHAGSGQTLGQAARPGYFESTKGRMALISFASTFTPMSRAGEARDDVPGRPGLNPLRIERRYQADQQSIEALRRFAKDVGVNVPADLQAPLRLLGSTIEPGQTTQVVEAVNRRDEERILREIRNAADQADYVIVTSHTHEPGNDVLVPAAWTKEFARKCIDAGASTYILHGPHQLRGVEVYKGRPIFYSLGNFIFQNETLDPMPWDHYDQYGLAPTALAADVYNARFKNGTTGFPTSPVWYESVIAVPVFKGRDVVEMRFHPIELGWKMPRSQRGTPRAADEATGRRIIGRLAKLSAEFGTTIQYASGIGIWRASAAVRP